MNDHFNPDGSTCGWAKLYYPGRDVGRSLVNSRNDILPYHFLNATNFYTGCSKFDKDYIDKELNRKGKEAFGVFHHGPESSTITT